MRWSESTTELSTALVAALGELEDLVRARTANTGSYSYNYADLSDILGAARPKLAEHKLAVLQSVGRAGDFITVTTTLLHQTGEWVESDPLLLTAGNTAQMSGSAITYARRYSLLAMLGLATEDDEGAAASPQASATHAAAPSAAREPTYRTREEADIRTQLGALSAAEVRRVQEAFKEQFGKSLSQLETARHAEALTFVNFLLAPTNGEAAEAAAQPSGA